MLGKNEMPIAFPLAAALKKLDLLYALLDTEDHCTLIQKCPNLEVLETRNVIGDRGLEVLARSCKRLKRLRIERGAVEQGMEDEDGVVSQRGLMALAQGCLELEYLAVYVSDITNASLEYIGTHSKNLNDFRLVLLDREETITDLPLDNGVRALLRGCQKLRRFALYLRPGGLTDLGLSYVGRYSQNVRWMLLGYVGESDAGLLEFSKGCLSLQNLELRGCCFSEGALAVAVMQLTALRYLWVQGYRGSQTGRDLLAMTRPYWNIELIPPRRVNVLDPNGEAAVAEHPAHILAYYSLAGPRTDFPNTVIPLYPESLINA
ncbi:putative leucine-rich repeat domain, L domain-containing protein [Rosa chinensis]|uniref:Putative leucine-rich repeat domain, L domain-containing protein n=1 Tax=Rosa chinensis TaxID=74649 RepID=A0A2P6SL13_ROSCH|nr:coronatine-insensitive protein 1-like [Rosa chinensis]PRQ59361.1 putative leucine-rich repeat domain, L domain-containing protein [Rosa chinensis]